jgi:dicarboxylate/amino acid:cation (Na+ or H+) symporter, DAACS family
MTSNRTPMRPSTKIMLGLVGGAAAGGAINWLYAPARGEPAGEIYEGALWFSKNLAKPVGDVFLGMLFMVVVPLVFCSLVLGVAGIGASGALGRVGLRTLGWFLGTTALAVVLGLTLVNVAKPGASFDPVKRDEIKALFAKETAQKTEQATAGTGFKIETFVAIVPRNVIKAAANEKEVLGVIFFAIMLGIAAAGCAPEKTKVFLDFLQTFYDLCVKVLGYAMKLAPYGVAGLIFHVTVQLGFDVIKALGFYVVVAIFGLLFHQFVVLGGLVAIFLKMNPLRFFARIKGLMATAFSTSSSNATLPTTIRTAVEEFGVPQPVAGFVMPLGATMNMNGTALFEGVTVLFLAQVSGVELSLVSQAIVLGFAILTAIGAAGVPGGSLPLLAIVLTQVGIEADMIGLILGVDRLVDMTRTVPNVTSDLIGSLWIARTEGRLLKK